MIGQRIKIRREELQMTQEELAALVGYKSKTTINKIENGVNELRQSKIYAFAQALDTSPGYLMGWKDEKHEVPEFNPDHIVLIDMYSKLNQEQQKLIFDMIKNLLSNSQ